MTASNIVVLGNIIGTEPLGAYGLNSRACGISLSKSINWIETVGQRRKNTSTR
jgi:hypothetical protein